MHLSRLPVLAAAAAALVLPAVASAPSVASATSSDATGQQQDGHYRFAVIGDVPYGDVPYGDVQVATFTKWVDQINATPDLSFTIHVGDIKNGSSTCTNEYFSMIRTQFDRFTMPLV